MREAAATAALNHPNVVEIFDYGKADDGRYYYAMEYLDGPDLGKLVKTGDPLPPGRVVFLLRQVCGALTKAHGDGLIHRDIKPSNIIACARDGVPDVAKLLDFGLVRAVRPGPGEEQTLPSAVLGTPGYMSPEQAKGHKLDRRSDLYSLGATAYFLLTGKTPNEPDSRWADVPADLQATVLCCLEKDPARRFQSADELEKALSGCACAAQWDRANAAAWWRDHGTTYQTNPKDP